MLLSCFFKAQRNNARHFFKPTFCTLYCHSGQKSKYFASTRFQTNNWSYTKASGSWFEPYQRPKNDINWPLCFFGLVMSIMHLQTVKRHPWMDVCLSVKHLQVIESSSSSQKWVGNHVCDEWLIIKTSTENTVTWREVNTSRRQSYSTWLMPQINNHH